MIHIRFPDGSIREYPIDTSAEVVAMAISPSLAKKAFLARINGELSDLKTILKDQDTLEFIARDHPDALDTLRHDTAHLFAEAVKELYPETQITIGPCIENGFYYDIFREAPLTPDDLVHLEKKMQEIVDRDEPITREDWDRQEAIDFFKSIGEYFKAEIIADLPESEQISVYRQGSFIDLCRGPHGPSTKKIGKSFKLMRLAGAYWRGDHRNPMLQRIYGTTWASEEDLKTYLHQLEEAEKRDHRKLGREMGLFHMDDVAVGAVFWHPKGWTLYRQLKNFIRDRIATHGYQEVNTPSVVDRKLWEKSGHWEKFRQNMMTVVTEDDQIAALKPMNCPCHIEIFKQGIRSYRDLPLRLAEFGSCHRYEPSGALHGLMRVRAFVQDDAHIFCTEEQILSEAKNFCTLLIGIYRDLGFTDVNVKFADRPAWAGADETWDKAENALKDAVESAGIPYTLNPGEGAFYGPKLEFHLKDAIGREWQCGTLQLDFILPQRLGAAYIGEDGQKHVPVMLHRAILGTFERFIGILLEHYAGRLPLWLAPVQGVVLPITNVYDFYGKEILNAFQAAGLRVDGDFRHEKVTYKIREHSLKKVPYLFIVGAIEAENKTVTIRRLGHEEQETLALPEIIDRLKEEIMKFKGE